GARGRRVVHPDPLELRRVEALEALEAVAVRRAAVVGAVDDRHAPPLAIARERRIRVGTPNRGERRLRPAPLVRQTELPVLDVLAPAIPLVGPREDERAGAPRRERRAELPAEDFRLSGLSVPEAVEPDLAQEERP